MSSSYSDMRDRERDRDMKLFPSTYDFFLQSSFILFLNLMQFIIALQIAGSPAERLSAMNASRSVEKSQPMFEAHRPTNEDVYFDLIDQEKVAWGQPFNFQVQIQVNFTHIFSLSKSLFVNFSN
jgi:transglutaminase 1